MSDVFVMTYLGPGQFTASRTVPEIPEEKALAACLLRTAVALAHRRKWDPKGSEVQAWRDGAGFQACFQLPRGIEIPEDDLQRLRNALAACGLRKDLMAKTTIRIGTRQIPAS